jgi:signal transduction histidine kinase
MSMDPRKYVYEDTSRSVHPLASVAFPMLLQEPTDVGNEKTLRDFLVNANTALHRATGTERFEKITWVKDTLPRLLMTNQQLMVEVLQDLLQEMKLSYGEPLIELMFEAASEVPSLFSVLGEVVQRENQLLQLRVRVLEAALIKSTQDLASRGVGSDAERMLRLLNQITRGLEQGSLSAVKNLYQGLPQNFRSLNRLTVRVHVSGAASSSTESYREILHWTEEAIIRLAHAPTSRESILILLEILKANQPLPAWHPASGIHFWVQEGHSEREESTDRWTILPLIVDKAIETVFRFASIEWLPDIRGQRRRETLEEMRFSLSNPATLEGVVVDPNFSPKLRRTVAALLRILGYPLRSDKRSSRVQFYSDLLLMPSRPDALPYALEFEQGVGVIDAEEEILYLLEALDERSDFVRWNASRACVRAAQDHPAWFHPKHYSKLLLLLTDEHRGVRLGMVKTFSALALSKEQQLEAVIHGITESLTEKVNSAEESSDLRRDLEMALGMSLSGLIERVDELQAETRDLEDRRRKLIGYIEHQNERIGEEIHHEILNTLCGYLATALDEERLDEAKKWLTELVTELRRIMNNLYPRDLETEGFWATIRKRLEDAKVQAQKRAPAFSIAFDCPEDIKDGDVAEKLTDPSHLALLYRIVLEAIINARKHSRGTFICVRVRRMEPSLLEIAVSDNGCGNGGPFEHHVGIPLMHRRAQEIGAEIAFQITPLTGGTTVLIRLHGRKRA